MEEIKMKRMEINEILSEEIQKNIIYTKQNYYEAGSRSVKLLAYRLKKQETGRHVYKIKDPQAKSFEFYYNRLYSQIHKDNKSQIDEFLNRLNLRQITEEQNNSLVSQITVEEINSNAISKLQNNKSPGADGYISE